LYTVQSAIPLCYIASSPRPPLLHAVGRQVGKQVHGRRACRKSCTAGRQSGRKVGKHTGRQAGIYCIGVRQEGKLTSSKESRMKGRKDELGIEIRKQIKTKKLQKNQM
jgi:hypothetical protein